MFGQLILSWKEETPQLKLYMYGLIGLKIAVIDDESVNLILCVCRALLQGRHH